MGILTHTAKAAAEEDSPCTTCAGRLRVSLHPWKAKNPTVHWKLGYTALYLAPKQQGHVSEATARQAMDGLGVAVKYVPNN
jgi:hypothetical protein